MGLYLTFGTRQYLGALIGRPVLRPESCPPPDSAESIAADRLESGKHWRQALDEEAAAIGGDALVAQIRHIAGVGPMHPSPSAVTRLQQLDPTSPERVVRRVEEIRTEQSRRRIAELKADLKVGVRIRRKPRP